MTLPQQVETQEDQCLELLRREFLETEHSNSWKPAQKTSQLTDNH